MASSSDSFPDLRTFLAALRRRGELVEIESPVDASLEVAEIHRRVIAAGGPALLFRNVRGSRFPLVTNLFGTWERARLAFSDRPFELVERLARAARELMPPSARRLWAFRDLAATGLRLGMRYRATGPVGDVQTDAVDLSTLPVPTTWSGDGGPFLTLPLVYTEHPDGGGHNLGVYRMQVYDERTTGMHWQIGKGGGFHYAVAEARGEALPVSVFLGGPPALTLAAVAPLPENVPELLLASLILGHKLRRCRGPGPHPLIADAEFALMGTVPAGVRRPEGPFGDHYGYYSLQHDYPVFVAEHLCHRRDAILPATVVGKPRQEDFYIGDLLQELLAPLFPLAMPGVVDLWSYGETGYHSLAAAVVRERYRREAMASAFRILGEGQLSLTKFLFATDQSVDLRDFPAVLEHVLERSRPETDLFVFGNLSMDTLDYTGPVVNEGSKGVWLGLGDPVRALPRQFDGALPAGVTAVEVFCPGCLVVGTDPRDKDRAAAERLARAPELGAWPLIVVTEDPARAAASPMNFLWSTFTRFEPAADIHAAARRIERNHVVFKPPVVIDARLHAGFPDELFCDPETAATVTRRWNDYFPDGDVEMGDSGTADLTE
jgi:UbiD family decarboxylase